jgi:hypothetical protein
MAEESVLHRAEGQATTGAALWYLIAFGVIGALTALLVSFALPIGPWWMWLLVIAGFVWLGKWELGRSAVVIELYERDGALRLRVSGRGAQLDEEIRREHDRWTHLITSNVRHGGPMYRYNLTVQTIRGRRIGFHSLGGRLDLGWPERRNDDLGDGPDIFSTFGVYALEKALQAAAVSVSANVVRAHAIVASTADDSGVGDAPKRDR